MSMLEDAINSLLIPGLKVAMGKDAVYQRGATSISLTVIAQEGGREKEYAAQIGDTVAVFTPELGYAGFSVEGGELATLTPPIPQRGDKIIIGSVVYALLAPQDLEPWRYEDLPFKTLFRCHTKKISE